jgi:hypothetical protein
MTNWSIQVAITILASAASATQPATEPASGTPQSQGGVGPSVPASTQAIEVIELHLLGSPADAPQLRWDERTPRLSWGRVFREMRVVVIEPTGKRFEISAVNAFAIAYDGRITNIEVRPDWPKGTGAQLAKRIEDQLAAWGVNPRDDELAPLDELRKMGIPQGPSSIWGYRFQLGGDVVFRVRIQGARREGWFGVFEFGLPLEKRPK